MSERRSARWLWWAGLALAVVVAGVATFRQMAADVPRKQSQAYCTVGNLGGIWIALEEYSDIHGEYPVSLASLIDRGLTTETTLRCPFQAYKGKRGVDYSYVRGLHLRDPGDWLVAFDRRGNHPDGSRSVLYVSGRTASLSADEFVKEYERFAEEFRRARGAPPEIE